MRSLWLELAGAGGHAVPPLAGEVRCDVVVVGGGYTGLWSALRLRELDPALDVVVVEAGTCGGGASGRNGGMALSWWSKLPALEARCGTAEALRLARASADAVGEIAAFCDGHRIDAELRRGGWLWAATSRPWLGAWRETVERLDAVGEHPFVEVDAEEARRRTGSPAQLGGVFEEAAATLQPALLAAGLRSVALARGVRVWEGSPVVRREGTAVHTARGTVTADRVVLALGAWSAQLPPLRRSLVVVSSDMVATAPIPERLDELGWTDGLAVSDARPRTEYYRTTPDGRLAFGKGGGALARGGRIGPEFDGSPSHLHDVAAAFRRVYPSLRDVPVAAAWTGPVERSRSGLPFFTRLAPGVVCGAGYSGRGVAQSLIGGRILASLALDLDDEWAGCGLVGPPPGGFPAEPARSVGGVALRAAVAAVERAEDAGRRAPALARAAERLAPAGVLPRRASSG